MEIKPIKTAADHQAALEEIDRLWQAVPDTPQGDQLDMLITLVDAWEDLNPTLPVFFCVRGTGEEEAQALLKDRLGITPFETMDDTIRSAVEAAR